MSKIYDYFFEMSDKAKLRFAMGAHILAGGSFLINHFAPHPSALSQTGEVSGIISMAGATHIGIVAVQNLAIDAANAEFAALPVPDMLSNREKPFEKPHEIVAFTGTPCTIIEDKAVPKRKSALQEYVMAGVNLLAAAGAVFAGAKWGTHSGFGQACAGGLAGNFVNHMNKTFHSAVIADALSDPYLTELRDADFVTGREKPFEPADPKFLATCKLS